MPDFLQSLAYPSSTRTVALGTRVTVGSYELGLVLGDASGNEFELEFTYGRFSEAFAVTAGIPTALLFHATYGNFCFVKTYASAQAYSFRGITPLYSVAPAAGDYGWIQTGGLNGWAITTSEAIAAGTFAKHTGSGTTIEEVDSDAERENAFLLCLNAVGSATASAVGDFWIGSPIGM
jgi:hypothetical protein